VQEALTAEDDAAEAPLLPRSKSKTLQLRQGIFEHVTEHIRREPAQSTRLLEAWIGSSYEERN
jgi:flagellar M-ring protein FliF